MNETILSIYKRLAELKDKQTDDNAKMTSYIDVNEIKIDSKSKFVLYNLEHGIFDNKTFYNLHKKAAEISLIDNFEKLIALDNVKVTLFPHQVDTLSLLQIN